MMGPRMGKSGRARCRGWLAVSASACLLLAGPSSAAGTSPSGDASTTEWGSAAASVEALEAAAEPAEGRLTSMALQSQPGYLVWDEHPDPLGDPVNDSTPGQPAVMTPELVGSVMATPDDDPATSDDERALLLFLASTTPGQPTNAADHAVVALDTNGDLLDDYVTYSPDPPFGLEPMPYETPVLRVAGSQQTDTGERAVWLRYADRYGVALDAWALGLTSVRFAMELEDQAGNYDWSPDDYAGESVSLPQPPPPPPPAPVLPSSPESVVSWPSDGEIQVLFQGSTLAGSSPITHYTVTANPGGATCTTSQPPYPATSPRSYECWIRGLTNGQPYLVSVTAHSAAGASVPRMAVNGAVTPLPFVVVRAKAKRSRSVLFIDVDPNLGRGYWKFYVYKLKGAEYVKVKGYKTLGSKETRTVNLKKGTYKVQVLPKPGYLATWSQPVTLRK